MNLVAFSIKTKGARNFIRRLWTVFTRFGFSESRTRHALYAVVNSLRQYRASPTFFIPAVVLKRHPMLIAEIALQGAEIGIHGYIHNDYRFLSEGEQHKHTQCEVDMKSHSSFFRPYHAMPIRCAHILKGISYVFRRAFQTMRCSLIVYVSRKQKRWGVSGGT